MKNLLILCAFFVFTQSVLAKPFKRALLFGDIGYSQLAPIPGVSAIFPEKDRLWTVAGGDPSVFIAALKLEDKKFQSEMTFQSPENERVAFDKSVPAGHWRGILPFVKDTMLFLNGAGASLMALEAKDGKFISHRQIVVDLLKPAADTRGEPTVRETSALRKAFASRFVTAQNGGLALAGFAPAPKSWRKDGGVQFVVATTVKGYPLVTMRCDESDVSQCQLVRVCDLAGWRPKDPRDVVGVAVDDKEGLLLIGDRGDHSVHVFKASGCAHSPHLGDLHLADKLKSLNGVALDAERRLWLATEKPDDYRNGSVFMWPKW